ncbi:MAG: hypothetical protein ACRDJE_22310 [Dehalococcoidia bacterium]
MTAPTADWRLPIAYYLHPVTGHPVVGLDLTPLGELLAALVDRQCLTGVADAA